MLQDKTTLFNFEEPETIETRNILDTVYNALEERGYNAVNQIVGYLISGDPGYISSYKGARQKMQEVDRTQIVEILLQEFRKNRKWDI